MQAVVVMQAVVPQQAASSRPVYLVVFPVYDGEGSLLSQVLCRRAVVQEGLGALASADLFDGAHVEAGTVSVLLGGLPAQTAEVCVQGVEATVDPRVRTHLLDRKSTRLNSSH